jgi:hypothetical protein
MRQPAGCLCRDGRRAFRRRRVISQSPLAIRLAPGQSHRAPLHGRRWRGLVLWLVVGIERFDWLEVGWKLEWVVIPLRQVVGFAFWRDRNVLWRGVERREGHDRSPLQVILPTAPGAGGSAVGAPADHLQKVHCPLGGVLHKQLPSNTYCTREATWRSGDAADCKSAYSGSIPDVASNKLPKTHRALNVPRTDRGLLPGCVAPSPDGDVAQSLLAANMHAPHATPYCRIRCRGPCHVG